MRVVLQDKNGNPVTEVETADGPFTFVLQTTTGPKTYTLSIIYKRAEDGTKDPSKIKGAMLQ